MKRSHTALNCNLIKRSQHLAIALLASWAAGLRARASARTMAASPWDCSFGTAEEHYPGLSHSQMDATLRKTYVVAENVTCLYFAEDQTAVPAGSPKPEPLQSKHPLNREEQQDTIDQYAELTLKKGMAKGKGAEPIAVPAEPMGQSFGTMPGKSTTIVQGIRRSCCGRPRVSQHAI